MADCVTALQTARRLLTGMLSAFLLTGCVTATGCSDPAPKTAPTQMAVTVGGTAFNLDLAIDEATRTKGLGDRTEIAPAGGMLFSFKTSDKREFVMRDCVIPIDIIFLDGTGRVTAKHKMTVEPPRGEGEGVSGDYQNQKYAIRLKRYSSRYSAKYAIELAGNSLDGLEVEIGDLIDLDTKLLERFTK